MCWVLQIPYREARDGFWGPQTSTLNWCEEDYNITHYCAETINTLSNIIFICLGIKGIRNVLRYSHPPIFLIAWLGYIIVGLGSVAFHATLLYSMQLADELPMIYTTCVMGFAAFAHGKSVRTSWVIAMGLGVLAVSITAYYLKAKNPVFHQVAYGILTLCVVLRGAHMTKHRLRPALMRRDPTTCDALVRDTWKIAKNGMVMFLIGFFLWNMDNIFCNHLRGWRSVILLPWSVLLEGHAWWHLFTGLGAYNFITWRVCLDHGLDESKRVNFTVRWIGPGELVPEVVPAEVEGHAGHSVNEKHG